jgi:RimJ/RimL family protein N-acetyltransferase
MIEAKFFLRDVLESDLPTFYEDQLDEEAIRMVVFTSRDKEAFYQHWQKIMADQTSKKQTIVWNGEVAGNVLAFTMEGEREIGYWIGKKYWGKGIATRAVAEFLRYETARPLSAHIAKHNKGSIRVLEKCGFTLVGEDKEFAKTGEETIPGVVMRIE